MSLTKTLALKHSEVALNITAPIDLGNGYTLKSRRNDIPRGAYVACNYVIKAYIVTDDYTGDPSALLTGSFHQDDGPYIKKALGLIKGGSLEVTKFGMTEIVDIYGNKYDVSIQPGPTNNNPILVVGCAKIYSKPMLTILRGFKDGSYDSDGCNGPEAHFNFVFDGWSEISVTRSIHGRPETFAFSTGEASKLLTALEALGI